jgi:ribosomal protein S18 acetylase RimI-like enzyme
VVEANTRAIELYERHGFRPFVRSMLATLDDRGGDDPAGD